MNDFSKLLTFIADDKDFGRDSSLVIKGFSGEEEILSFLDCLYSSGIIKPKKELLS